MKNYKDITYQVATQEGYPVTETVTAEEQRDFVSSGCGTVAELIELNISAYRDWQADC